MLNKNEITSLNLSTTKKDFVQIWNELLEVAGKLSERWDPTSTNESDPGIVILKALAGIADKLNYNIDKNILEAFMPTAAQEDSMRKLCDMLGYNIKYYQSALAEVTIKYHNSEATGDESSILNEGLIIPKFTVITNGDQDINYFTTEAVTIYSNDPSRIVNCLEGQIVKCESSNNDNVITTAQISERNRFYLPETQIAENGIFIYNVFSLSSGAEDGERWEQVDNLNVQPRKSKVYKFGFDSYESRPYVEFPEDYSELFRDGLFIYYTRTSGANGNISPRTLTQIELPTGEPYSKITAGSFSAENIFAATTGANIETISQSYNNYKKTIGTFETLVTCRDYMNKIYTLLNGSNKPYVSNILVTDIRNDINRAITICSCDDSGILYKETPLVTSSRELYTKTDSPSGEAEFAKTVVVDKYAIDHFDLIFYPFKSYNQIKSNVKSIRNAYDSSFTYTDKDVDELKRRLSADSFKTISHNIKTPRIAGVDGSEFGDIVSINNYLRLNMTIATNSKITVDEGDILKDKIKIALANAFNMRELDFGEEIPFDSIVEVVENADPRIRVASLNEPALYTTFSVLDSYKNNLPVIKEYAVASDELTLAGAIETDRFANTEKDGKYEGLVVNAEGEYVGTYNTEEARKIYNKLAVRNVLAGRVPLFNYNNTFTFSFSEGPYQVTRPATDIPVSLLEPTEENPFTICTYTDKIYTGQWQGTDDNGAPIIEYTETVVPEEYADSIITTVNNNYITDIVTHCEINADVDDDGQAVISDVKLENGEFIQFRAPNFITSKTYPAYVNYHLDLNTEYRSEAINAEATLLFDLLNEDISKWSPDSPNIGWQKVLDYFGDKKTTLKHQIKVSKYSEYECKGEDNPTKNKAHVKNEETGYCLYCGGEVPLRKGTVIINTAGDEDTKKLKDLLNTSSCVKLVNDGLKAKIKLEWSPENDEITPDGTGPRLPIELNLSNPFITDFNAIESIQAVIQEQIEGLIVNYEKDSTSVALPTECSWVISLEFEGVPFETETLKDWENFLKANADSFDFAPIVERDTIIWRAFEEGQGAGKYILANGSKLLRFSSNYFSSYPESPLKHVYVAKSLGKNIEPIVIKNNEEYVLKDREYLYIEYTPSSTTDEGSTQTQESVTEIYGPGTRIRPSGFESGIMDSDTYERLGHTPHKEVNFNIAGAETPITMQRFGANEQVEIREYAQFILDKDTFNSSTVYYYKNFNDCPELEKADQLKRTYTLKEGEWIAYTDQNKNEFAYYSTGTQVTLEGNVLLKQFDKKDLTEVFDNGTEELPWARLSLSGKDKVIFQEYQYITLGEGDTLSNLTLIAPSDSPKLDNIWQYCDGVEYKVLGADTPVPLEKIDISDLSDKIDDTPDKGNGWQVSSTLILDVAKDRAQTLRNNDKVKTSIDLFDTSPSGEGQSKTPITVKPVENGQSISFKTNLTCQTGSNQINIKDILYNPDKLKGFEVKVFALGTPSIVETEHGKVIPYQKNSTINIANWPGDSGAIIASSKSELWNSVDIEEVRVSDEKDSALKLSVNVLPKTYGVFCIYINYTNSETANTWIEVLPGITEDDVALLNADGTWEKGDSSIGKPAKLFLQPGINCIRVNKSTPLFIKASEKAQGSLLFDDLRLVNRELVKYKDANGNHEELTSGLNMKQIGYLMAAPQAILDEKMVEAYKESFIEKARTDLNKQDTQAAETFNLAFANLIEDKDKLEKFKSIISSAKEEIETLLTNHNSEDLRELFLRYYQIYQELKREQALSKALKSNASIDEVEQQLIALINGFYTVDSDKQQLLAALIDWRTQIINDSELLVDNSYDALKTDFSRSLDADEHDAGEALTKMHKYCFEKIDTIFVEQLSLLVAELDKAENTDERNSLLSLLTSLQQSRLDLLYSDLMPKIRELSEVAENSQTNVLLESVVNYATNAQYTNLALALTQLVNQLENDKLTFLVTEIELAVANQSNVQLANLLDALKSSIDAADNSLIAEVKALLELVKSKVGENTTDSEIITKALNLRNTASEFYETELKAIIRDLTTLITNADKTFSTAIEALQESKDKQISYILTALTSIIAQRNTDLETLEMPGYRYHTQWKYIEDAFRDIWAKEYMKRDLTSGIDMLYSKAKASVNSVTELSYSLSKFFYTDDMERDMLIQAANLTVFDAIAEQINRQAQRASQNNTRAKIIEDINLYLPIIPKLEEAMSEVSTNSIDKNSVVVDLINKLLDDSIESITEKQRLITLLKKELQSLIDVDDRLLSISAKLLCPSILRFEEYLPAEATQEEKPDEFYSKLVSALTIHRNSLLSDGVETLNSISASLESTVNSDCAFITKFSEALKTKQLEDFKDTVLSLDFTNTLLSTKYFNNKDGEVTGLTEDLKTAVFTQKGVLIIKESGIFGELSDIEISKDNGDTVSSYLAEIMQWLNDNRSKLTKDLASIITALHKGVNELRVNQNIVTDEFKDAYIIHEAEKELLSAIRALDLKREFYYNVPIETNLAIDFNDSDDRLCSLASPLISYDINNINNNFVISKLDIDYLDKGIQIARSSRF